MQIMNISTWADFKTLLKAKLLLIQYSETATTYEIFAPESATFLWTICLLKDSDDALDFEQNFKKDANQPLEVKATSTQPQRVVPTAQPLNTTEKWKGYQVNLTAQDTEQVVLVNFPVDVWLRGGSIYSIDASPQDYITVDVVWTDYPQTIIYPNLLENIYLLPGIQIPFISAECMKFPTMLSLAITYHKYDDSKTRCVSATANFFEPPQL